MYLPKINRETDPNALNSFMQQHSFATLISNDADNVPFATHLPVLLDTTRGERGTLVAHMARANPHWRHFSAEDASSSDEVLVVFQGPHAYISPSWYASEFSVPTWNYTAVHAYGKPKIVQDGADLRKMLTELVATYEPPMAQASQVESSLVKPWSTDWSDARNEPLLKAIVGFELEITRLEGKFKLSQNKPAADRAGVIKALQQSTDQDERGVADMMSCELANELL